MSSAVNNELTEIALFPIPDMVSFPGATVPLHVFEPRYRKMIHDCVEGQRMIGVCHTRKAINTGPKQQSMEEALSSNQATYQPQPVFSAGLCKIQDVLEDGRILVLIEMSGRYRMVSEQQALPYRIALCEQIEDVEDAGDSQESAQLKTAIIERMLELTHASDPKVSTAELEQKWQALTPEQFSFQFFEFVRFDADLMQSILENTSSLSRLRVIADVLQAA